MRSASTSPNAPPRLTEPDPAESRRRLDAGVVARVVAIKQILAESYLLQGVPSALVREAIAAAEAEAWRAGFPHLFLPDLTDEILRRLRQKGSSIRPEYAQAA
jgi:hypothetical protein